jgi:hypothetical protein
MIKKIIIEHEDSFIGYVYENGVAVTVGIMLTEAEMNKWLDDAIARRAWETASELPDMYNQVN